MLPADDRDRGIIVDVLGLRVVVSFAVPCLRPRNEHFRGQWPHGSIYLEQCFQMVVGAKYSRSAASAPTWRPMKAKIPDANWLRERLLEAISFRIAAELDALTTGAPPDVQDAIRDDALAK